MNDIRELKTGTDRVFQRHNPQDQHSPSTVLHMHKMLLRAGFLYSQRIHTHMVPQCYLGLQVWSVEVFQLIVRDK